MEITDENGAVVETFSYEKGEQVISEKTSQQMKTILESVVSEGTGNKAYIPGYRIGGKTATSEKLPRKSGKYIASFLTFAPAENPQVLSLVLINEPQGNYYGGTVAGPVMKELLQNILPYLGIEPIYTEKEMQLEEVQKIEVEKFVGMTVQEAKKALYEQNITYEIQGEGESIISQIPKEGELVNQDTKILLFTQ